MGGLFQLFFARSGDFQELGYYPVFGLLCSALELLWHLWMCNLANANVLQWAYNEAQGLLKFESSTILGLIGSNQFMSYSVLFFFNWRIIVIQCCIGFYHTPTWISHIYVCYAVLSHSVVSDSVTSWTVAHQAPLSMAILQAKILEWVFMPSSRWSSQPRDWTEVSRIAGKFLTIWATREAQEYWSG